MLELEELKKRFNGMCGYLIEKGMKPEMVKSLSRKSFVEQYTRKKKKEEMKKAHAESSKSKYLMISLLQKEQED